MQKSESIAALAAALTKAQAEIGAAPKSNEAAIPGKDGKTGYRYRYADLAAVWEACREPLTKHGLSVLQLPQEAPQGQVRLLTLLLHESGEHIGDVFSLPAAGGTPQAIGSALTYLRRYSLAALVGVVADDDDDGQAASQSLRRQSQSRTNGASYAPTPGENVDTETGEIFAAAPLQVTRIREQLRALAQATGDPLAPEVAIDYTKLTPRQLDAFSTDLHALTSAQAAGHLDPDWVDGQSWRTQTGGRLAQRLGAAADLSPQQATPGK